MLVSTEQQQEQDDGGKLGVGSRWKKHIKHVFDT